MGKHVIDVVEKNMLVDMDSAWEPDTGLLMHVAGYSDHGAHPEVIDENIQLIIDEGGNPQKVRLTIKVFAEYIDA